MSELDELEKDLRIAFEKRETKRLEDVELKFVCEYSIVTVDWRKLAEVILKREANARAAEDVLRQYLWLSHGHVGLYGDDGEMQCGICHVDYKRDDINLLVGRAWATWEQDNLKRCAAQQGDSPKLTDEEIIESFGCLSPKPCTLCQAAVKRLRALLASRSTQAAPAAMPEWGRSKSQDKRLKAQGATPPAPASTEAPGAPDVEALRLKWDTELRDLLFPEGGPKLENWRDIPAMLDEYTVEVEAYTKRVIERIAASSTEAPGAPARPHDRCECKRQLSEEEIAYYERHPELDRLCAKCVLEMRAR